MSEHFRTEVVSGCQIIRCLTDLTDQTLTELTSTITNLSNSSSDRPGHPILILELTERPLDEVKFFRAITPIGLNLKKKSSKLYVVCADSAFERVVKNRGMDGILAVFPTLADILKSIPTPLTPLKKNASKADAVFLNSFIDATIKTLQVQCNVKMTASPPCSKTNAAEMPYDIAGVIALASEAFHGSIAICYPKETFLALIGSMLGESYSEITTDLEDGAAELLNMIFGQAKVALNEKSYAIEKAIPTIIRGEALSLKHFGSGPSIVIPFESSVGALRMEINIEAQETASKGNAA